MKRKPLKPSAPRAVSETVRHAITDLLREMTLSARDISELVRIAEKDVYPHLEHIRRSIQTEGSIFDVIPAECRSCGFVFIKRERLAPPGKCPVCRHESIFNPLFTIRSK